MSEWATECPSCLQASPRGLSASASSLLRLLRYASSGNSSCTSNERLSTSFSKSGLSRGTGVRPAFQTKGFVYTHSTCLTSAIEGKHLISSIQSVARPFRNPRETSSRCARSPFLAKMFAKDSRLPARTCLASRFMSLWPQNCTRACPDVAPRHLAAISKPFRS